MKYNIVAILGVFAITLAMVSASVLGYRSRTPSDAGNYTIVDSVLMAHDNITQRITVLDYNTAGGAGKRLYRISCYVVRQNAASGSPTLSFSYGDYITSTNVISYIAVTSPNLQLENGGEPAFSGTNHQECLPTVFYASVSPDIIVYYRDPVGTPNDYLFVTLEVF